MVSQKKSKDIDNVALDRLIIDDEDTRESLLIKSVNTLNTQKE